MHQITKPAEGSVTLTLNWLEAEALTRIVGMTNSGNLRDFPILESFMHDMLEVFGRNTSTEAFSLMARIESGQVYVEGFDE